ncbi:fungal specific transcription factor [Akanthomyces lecanii RCEF 1005]|uniref:Fungal specific transcription factor n=1 Tax=Akanthomyces lecanii RCEF 1005 TaxID=1081108 RepID=A0A168K4V2_CORDF|nr:fungal specific transcription factor [Akanthomyces lecanii RCEF 1005]
MSADAEREKAARRRRDKPCSNCSSRGLASSCTFPDNSNPPSAPAGTAKAASFQDRINHLEGLVVQLLQQDAQPNKPPPLCAKCSAPLGGAGDDDGPHRPPPEPATATANTPAAASTPATTVSSPSRASHSHPLDVGKLQIDSAKSAYVSSPHWSAVLSGLSELKSFWPTTTMAAEDDDGDDDDFFPGDQSDNQYYKADLDSHESSPMQAAVATPGKRRFQLLFGGHKQQSLDEILQIMPPREVVDRLVLLYFNNMMLPLAVIHSGSFLAQYEKFWKSPYDAPILWIAMLLGIMSVASQTEAAWAHYASRSHPPSGLSPSTTNAQSSSLPLSSPFPLQTPPYVDQIVACLILGEYSKGGAYAIEALLHYQFIEVTSSADGHADAWLLSGIVTRLAYRMGYHRDPSHFASLSPFQGETRRRLWITVHAMDTMMSAQMGLPRLIKAGSADVRLPRNLHDADLDPACAALPPERPWTDLTPTLHLIAKHRLFVVIGTITDVGMSVDVAGPENPVAREKELTSLIRTTYDELPDQCKFHSMLGCIADKAADIIHRIGASALLQKGLIAIHWHRLMASDAAEEAEQLRDAAGDRAHVRQSYAMCIRAALKVLGFQSIVESESRPGGGLFPQRIQASSVIKHEFLMSTVVLCRHMYRVAAGPFGSPLLEVALEKSSSDSGDEGEAALPEPLEVEAALRHSHSIWQRGSSVSSEARRISSILDALFRKLGTSSPRPGEPAMPSASPFDDIDPGLALLDEFGLLHHLQDMNNCFDM